MAKKIKRWLKSKFQRRTIKPIRPYTKPQIFAIKLDPRQAIITQCVVGGGFMSSKFVGDNMCVGAGAPDIMCDSSVRGAGPAFGPQAGISANPS